MGQSNKPSLFADLSISIDEDPPDKFKTSTVLSHLQMPDYKFGVFTSTEILQMLHFLKEPHIYIKRLDGSTIESIITALKQRNHNFGKLTSSEILSMLAFLRQPYHSFGSTLAALRKPNYHFGRFTSLEVLAFLEFIRHLSHSSKLLTADEIHTIIRSLKRPNYMFGKIKSSEILSILKFFSNNKGKTINMSALLQTLSFLKQPYYVQNLYFSSVSPITHLNSPQILKIISRLKQPKYQFGPLNSLQILSILYILDNSNNNFKTVSPKLTMTLVSELKNPNGRFGTFKSSEILSILAFLRQPESRGTLSESMRKSILTDLKEPDSVFGRFTSTQILAILKYLRQPFHRFRDSETILTGLQQPDYKFGSFTSSEVLLILSLLDSENYKFGKFSLYTFLSELSYFSQPYYQSFKYPSSDVQPVVGFLNNPNYRFQNLDSSTIQSIISSLQQSNYHFGKFKSSEILSFLVSLVYPNSRLEDLNPSTVSSLISSLEKPGSRFGKFTSSEILSILAYLQNPNNNFGNLELSDIFSILNKPNSYSTQYLPPFHYLESKPGDYGSINIDLSTEHWIPSMETKFNSTLIQNFGNVNSTLVSSILSFLKQPDYHFGKYTSSEILSMLFSLVHPDYKFEKLSPEDTVSIIKSLEDPNYHFGKLSSRVILSLLYFLQQPNIDLGDLSLNDFFSQFSGDYTFNKPVYLRPQSNFVEVTHFSEQPNIQLSNNLPQDNAPEDERPSIKLSDAMLTQEPSISAQPSHQSNYEPDAPSTIIALKEPNHRFGKYTSTEVLSALASFENPDNPSNRKQILSFLLEPKHKFKNLKSSEIMLILDVINQPNNFFGKLNLSEIFSLLSTFKQKYSSDKTFDLSKILTILQHLRLPYDQIKNFSFSKVLSILSTVKNDFENFKPGDIYFLEEFFHQPQTVDQSTKSSIFLSLRQLDSWFGGFTSTEILSYLAPFVDQNYQSGKPTSTTVSSIISHLQEPNYHFGKLKSSEIISLLAYLQRSEHDLKRVGLSKIFSVLTAFDNLKTSSTISSNVVSFDVSNNKKIKVPSKINNIPAIVTAVDGSSQSNSFTVSAAIDQLKNNNIHSYDILPVSLFFENHNYRYENLNTSVILSILSKLEKPNYSFGKFTSSEILSILASFIYPNYKPEQLNSTLTSSILTLLRKPNSQIGKFKASDILSLLSFINQSTDQFEGLDLSKIFLILSVLQQTKYHFPYTNLITILSTNEQTNGFNSADILLLILSIKKMSSPDVRLLLSFLNNPKFVYHNIDKSTISSTTSNLREPNYHFGRFRSSEILSTLAIFTKQLSFKDSFSIISHLEQPNYRFGKFKSSDILSILVFLNQPNNDFKSLDLSEIFVTLSALRLLLNLQNECEASELTIAETPLIIANHQETNQSPDNIDEITVTPDDKITSSTGDSFKARSFEGEDDEVAYTDSDQIYGDTDIFDEPINYDSVFRTHQHDVSSADEVASLVNNANEDLFTEVLKLLKEFLINQVTSSRDHSNDYYNHHVSYRSVSPSYGRVDYAIKPQRRSLNFH